MKNKKLSIGVFLLIITFMSILSFMLLFDCGKEARQLQASIDDSIFYSPHKPKGVNLPEGVNTFLESLTESFEKHDLNAVMTHFSDDFLHQGMTKQAFRQHIAQSYFIQRLKSMTVTFQKFDPQGNVMNIAGFIETDLGVLLQSSEVLPIAEGSQLRLENGHWKFIGNQEKSSIGRFHDFLSIRVSFEPKDLELYRALLPQEFGMPEVPEVWVDITEHQYVSLPLLPYRLGRIQLLGTYQDEEGWYVLTLPETAWTPVKFGQIVGYPKYVVDSISFEQDNDSWKGQVSDNGQSSILSLEFTPDRTVETFFEKLTRPACLSLMRQLLPSYTYKPTYVLMRRSRGEGINGKTLTVKATVSSYTLPSISEELGKVKISVKQDEPWAGLFTQNAVLKGSFMRFSGDWNLKHIILNDGQENP